MSYTETRFGSAAAVAAGSLSARFEALLAQNGPALARIASSYTRTSNDGDDLLQDIAMAIWKALGHFRGECSERTFLFRIAHNRAIAYLARKRKDTQPMDECEFADPAPGAEVALLKRERNARLSEAVRLLPVAYRQPIILMLEGFDYAEIADIMGTSESNVGVRLTRARQLLRRSMEAES